MDKIIFVFILFIILFFLSSLDDIVSGVFSFFLLQYQNVFAPLIKLEADYDKVLRVLYCCLFLF